MDDLISRQAAIDALDALCDRECEYSKKQRSVMCGACHLGSAFDVVEQLPSAQSEITEEEVREWCYKRCLTVIDNALYLEMRSRWSASAQPKIEERKGKSAQNVPKEDLISRKAAIDAVGSMLRRKFGIGGDLAEITLAGLPSAQPEKHTEERTGTYACDCISRQMALDVMNGRFETLKQAWGDEIRKDGVAVYLDMRGIIEALPSEQPKLKKGKWIERNPQNSNRCRLIECDQCSFFHIVGFNVPYEYWIGNRNFCERCGAYMGGEQDETD